MVHFVDHHWSPNQTGEVERLALDAVRHGNALRSPSADEKERKWPLKWALVSENRPRRDDLLACAAAVESIAVDGSGWDTDPWLLGVRNGVFDLETGASARGSRLRHHQGRARHL